MFRDPVLGDSLTVCQDPRICERDDKEDGTEPVLEATQMARRGSPFADGWGRSGLLRMSLRRRSVALGWAEGPRLGSVKLPHELTRSRGS